MRFRLRRLSLSTAAVLAAPLLIVVMWYAWSAYASLDRSDVPLSWEMFHLALHDELTRDMRRMRLVDRPSDSKLPTIAMSLTRDNFDKLHRRKRVAALIQLDGQMREAEIRFRRGKPYHWLGTQKSIKVVAGARSFNLLNAPSPFSLEAYLINGLARELGLLTPEYEPAWVRVNNVDMGVYFFQAYPDEGLIRRARRMPGQLFSGDTEAIHDTRRVADLFFAVGGWKTAASRTVESAGDLSAIETMVAAIDGASHRDFARYAATQIDTDKYGLYDALDVVFGGDDHDYESNTKLYLDPYTGKLEPIAWAFRSFHHKPRFNLVENPLLLRLKMTPGYLAERNRAVYRLLTGVASVASLRERTQRAIELIAPDLAADPYWDAKGLLPRVSRQHRAMLRPMNHERWRMGAADDLDDFARRSRFLLDALERPEIRAHAERDHVELTIGGHAAYKMRAIELVGCDDVVPLGDHTLLSSGIRLEPIADPSPDGGLVQSVPEARRYRYPITSECDFDHVELELESYVTATSKRLKVAVSAAPMSTTGVAEPPPSPSADPIDAVPRLLAGERSVHPWRFAPALAPEAITLGPGEVHFAETRSFGAHQRVVIEPGTELLLAEGASLFFAGRVEARGTKKSPIRIAGRFGGVALQGRGTRGSTLTHVEIAGASRPAPGAIDYPAALNIHDTADVTLSHVAFRDISAAEDVIHINRVENVKLFELSIEDAPNDAVDIEIASGEVRGLDVRGAGDDCLDLMTATIRLADSKLAGCTGNGVSAGELSHVEAHGVVVSDSKNGVLAKNASEVRLVRSAIKRTHVALKTKSVELYYEEPSRIGASELIAVDVGSLSDGEHIDPGHVRGVL